MKWRNRLPWHQRAAEHERELHEARMRLVRVHQDWAPLADGLARIDREIHLNDWTTTAKRIFSGREETT